MFRRQEGVLREFTVYDGDDHDDHVDDGDSGGEGGQRRCEFEGDGLGSLHEDYGSNKVLDEEEGGDEDEDLWEHDDVSEQDSVRCPLCGCRIPSFALVAHERYHSTEDT
jgi:DNA polymerase iota